MEFKCNKNDISNGVGIVERIVVTKSTLPIIGNILLETGKDSIRLSTNNLEVGIQLTIPAKVIREGSVLIPAKTLGSIVSKLPNTDINFKVNDKHLIKITYKDSQFNIHGLPTDEFPTFSKIKDAKNLSIGAKILAQMIEQTIFSVSNSEDKHVLNGVLIESGKGKKNDNSNLRFVSTDGYRLAKRGEKISGTIGDAAVIVSARALTELGKILQSKDEGEVKIAIGNDQIAFNYGSVFIVSRLIQGQFPEYGQVIPKSSATKIVINTSAFLASAERAAVIASGSANIVKFELRSDKLHITSQAPDVGSIEEIVDVESKGGSKGSAAFNIKLITDVLKEIDEDKVSLEIGEPLTPGVIRPVEGPDYIYIVMPIRTQEPASV